MNSLQGLLGLVLFRVAAPGNDLLIPSGAGPSYGSVRSRPPVAHDGRAARGEARRKRSRHFFNDA